MDLSPNPSRFSAEIEAIAARVAQAREGRPTDFAALESQLTDLCRRLEAAPRSQARPHVSALQTLLLEIDLLAIDLENARRAG